MEIKELLKVKKQKRSNQMRMNKEIDIYDLINSKAISEHCRKIKHQFKNVQIQKE